MTWSRKMFLRLDVLSARSCRFRVRWWEQGTEEWYVRTFAFFLGEHQRYFWNMCKLPIMPDTGEVAFHWKIPLLLLVAQQTSLSFHCQKGLRTYYPLYIQLSQDVGWPLTFSKEFPHMFASQKFLRMWLLCFVFAVGSLPYFLVTDWDQVRKMLVFYRFQWTCSPIF